MAKLKTPKLAKPEYKGTQMQRSGELQKESQAQFAPLLKGKFLKGGKKLF